MDGAFGFKMPDYGDWATYGGFNRTTGEMDESRLAKAAKGMMGVEGVPPPQTLGDIVKAGIAPIQQRIAGTQAAFGQAMQGNILPAYQSMGKQTETKSSGFDFSANPHLP